MTPIRVFRADFYSPSLPSPRDIMANPDFLSGKVDTAWVERVW